MIHVSHKTIFIHNPKCGGGTIYTVLGGQGDVPALFWHSPWDVHKRVLAPSSIDLYFKFTFVRNPWDRLVSAYRWYLRGGHESARDKSIQAMLVQPFGAFVHRLKDFQACPFVDPGEPDYPIPHFLPQSFMLGDAAYDFVGRFERFRDDALKVFEEIGIDDPQLPHVHGSKGVDYRGYYDDETARIVAKEFEEDIDRFGYAF